MASTHGNYSAYYARRTQSRTALFPHSLFPHAAVLDVGSNVGHITAYIAQHLAPRIITGVDIDQTLVDAAWRHRLTAWSLASPHTTPDYFPASLPHELGPLPIPPSDDKHAFPHNLAFRCADWTKEDIPEDKDGYDIVLAYVLSITKWIHLNQGDDGLVAFFRKIHTVLHKRGHLILEPQPWESYAKARRMSEHLRATYQTLQLRPSNFPATLKDIGFEFVKTLGETGEGGASICSAPRII
ncbi:hypothetical protein AGABI2DRAFT_74961 [Agaricus bisporus var. bisporus H97]|uniref:hypothetical protein n=1 Tax=Agaricus bisporus var. bisporus (strain H97 / ATCC MYA-4626 / FGSC 10389) TaxID=936046 RepID=UPI00029F7A2B|nr:hypothetical protein AGABI2DRAFT_74961 [Agaricus bisporus var. bisporus H97]EKV44431.1 hypothetical protein AGABI2DRAFT_74961 [Agaricus bisporus var. bisporus H97]